MLNKLTLGYFEVLKHSRQSHRKELKVFSSFS